MHVRRLKKHKKTKRDKERPKTIKPFVIIKINQQHFVFKAKTDIKQSASSTGVGSHVGLLSDSNSQQQQQPKSVVASPKSFMQGQQSPHGDKHQSQVITQVHSTPLIKAATLKAGGIGGDQQHPLLQQHVAQQMQQQQLQQQQQQQQPSLVVSVPLSTANVPGVNLPSNTSATIVSPQQHQLNSSQQNNSSSLYQQLTQRNPDQLVSIINNKLTKLLLFYFFFSNA
jgi:hypothetical protein